VQLQVARSSVGFILFLFTRSRSKVISDDGGGGCVRTINNDSNNNNIILFHNSVLASRGNWSRRCIIALSLLLHLSPRRWYIQFMIIIIIVIVLSLLWNINVVVIKKFLPTFSFYAYLNTRLNYIGNIRFKILVIHIQLYMTYRMMHQVYSPTLFPSIPEWIFIQLFQIFGIFKNLY